MSKVKILDFNKNLLGNAQAMFENILQMQSDAEAQIKSIKSIEHKIVELEKEKKEKEAAKEVERQLQAEKEKMEQEQRAQKEQAEQQAALLAQQEAEKAAALAAEKIAQDKAEAEKAAAQEPLKQQTQKEEPKKVEQPQTKVKEQQPVREQVKPAREPISQDSRPREKAGSANARPASSKPQDRRQETREPRNEHAQKREHTGQRPPMSGAKPQQSAAKPQPVAAKPEMRPQRKTKKQQEEERNRAVKKSVIKERVFNIDEDEFPRGSRKRRPKKQQPKTVIETVVIDKAVITEETVSVKLLSEKIGKPVSEIIKKLMLLGIMSTINSQIDFDTAHLVAGEFGVELEQKIEKTAEDILVEDVEDSPESLQKRPPIVTIMGHVDHGKTSLLDRIRLAKVAEGEAGGITQHIGAYQIDMHGEKITFIDTPGHEAFTAMRARGAQVTDIAIIVVAADDGIMPQTVEAINHAKSAGVPIIVAINKMDKENSNPQRIMQDLTEYELLPEEWGGDTIVVPVSAKTGEGIDKLLEMILLVAEVQELKANPNKLARGTIVEAQLDKGRGPVATVLVESGTLKIGDTVIAGTAYGKIRAMIDDMGHNVEKALPSQPVEVIGLSEVPVAGDVIHAAQEDRLSRQVAEQRKDRQKAEMLKKMSKVSLDDLFDQIAEGQIKDLNIVIKADVQGSVEAVRQSLEKLSDDEVHIRVIHAGVGAIRETDVTLASAANAIIIGFNVRPDAKAMAAAEHEKVDVRLYRVIYKAIEDITAAMKGMLDPEYEEAVTGHAEVRQTFKVSSIGTIAGCYMTDGNIKRNSQVRLLRDNVVLYEGKLSSLKRFKDDVKEVAQGYECGMSLENYNDIKEGDVIEAFEMREIER